MNYAQRTEKVFSTKSKVLIKKSMSSEVTSRRQYIAEHTFSVSVDPSTKEASIEVGTKHAE